MQKYKAVSFLCCRKVIKNSKFHSLWRTLITDFSFLLFRLLSGWQITNGRYFIVGKKKISIILTTLAKFSKTTEFSLFIKIFSMWVNLWENMVLYKTLSLSNLIRLTWILEHMWKGTYTYWNIKCSFSLYIYIYIYVYKVLLMNWTLGSR